MKTTWRDSNICMSLPSSFKYFMNRTMKSFVRCRLIAVAVMATLMIITVSNVTLSYKTLKQGIHLHGESLRQKTIYEEKFVHKDTQNLYQDVHYWRKLEPMTHEDPSGREQIVLFDSSHYSGDLNFLNEHPKGWSVLVVNTKDAQQRKSCPNCLTLEQLGSTLVDILEALKTHGNGNLAKEALNKMAALVYVIQQKSPWIYVTEKPSPIPYNIIRKVIREPPKTSLVYNGTGSIFQPCMHFMDPFTWNEKALPKEPNRYTLRAVPPKSIYQIVDECYKPGMDSRWHDVFDHEAPMPYVSSNTWAAMDFKNVLVPLEAAWTLVASVAFTPPESNKSLSGKHFASLLVQRFLWETNSAIGFIPGYDYVQKCPSCLAENSFKTDYGIQHMKKLTEWKCHEVTNITTCIHDLLKKEIAGQHSKESKLLMVILQTWISVLEQHGTTAGWKSVGDSLNEQDKGRPIYFTPSRSLRQGNTSVETSPLNSFRDICKNKNMTYAPVIPKHRPPQFKDILLIISFNFNDHLSSIAYLEYMLGRHFKNIVYCASDQKAFKAQYVNKNQQNPVSLITVDTSNGPFPQFYHEGQYAYRCANAAMEMNYNVSGYLYMSDDVIFNMWNARNHPFHLPWYQTDTRVANLDSEITQGHDYGIDWWPWKRPTGKPAIKSAMDELKTLKNDTDIGARVSWFLNNIKYATSCDNCIAYMDADIYYVPAYMAPEFQFFLPYFDKAGVFIELAIPTILAGITPQFDRNLYRLRGMYLVGTEKRDNFEYGWRKHNLFVHPVKLSFLNKENYKKFYCEVIKLTDQDLLGEN